MSKFSYFKELVIPKVRYLIDGLPFTREGYTRAKNILLTKYGKTSIRADLVRDDDNWQDWKFQQLVEALENWTVRNPIPLNDKQNPEKSNGYSKGYLAKQTKSECVYCEKPDHRSCDCKAA